MSNRKRVVSGWNLSSIGETKSPADFNAALSVNPPTPGEISINLITLWAWDATQGNWYFYAPSLVARGGTSLTGYTASKGYLDFNSSNKKLGPGVRFWVNKP